MPVREHFDVRQLVRECQLLREYTLLYLHEHVAQFSIRDRSGMTTTELRAKIRAVPTGGLFFRLLTR